MSDSAPAEAVDGRRLRSERSRRAIIDGALALIDEGVLVPTAQQISERAGVGIRSFFRHFEDMEALFTAVDAQFRESYESMFRGGDRKGSLEQRLEQVVQRHAQAYDSLSNLMLASRSQLWRSAVIRKNYARSQRGLRKDLESWLPELAALPKHRREAVEAIASFDLWHRLRSQQGLSRKTSMAIVIDLLRNLVLEQ